MYDIKPLDLSPKGIEICAELLSLVYSRSDQASEEKYLNWEYNLNPIGKAVGYNAWYNNKLAAHYVAQPIIMLINGKEARGLLSINTATHPEHQRKKLFTTLADATYQHAKNLGYSFVIGVANANSTPGFIRKLGFELISPLTAKIGIGRINYQSTKNPNTCERLWSRESLKWRLRNPLKKYSINISNVDIEFDGTSIYATHFNSNFDLGDPSDLARKASVVGYYLTEEPCNGEIILFYSEEGNEIKAVTNCN